MDITVEINDRDKWSGSVDDFFALLDSAERPSSWYPVVKDESSLLVLEGAITADQLPDIEAKLAGKDGAIYVLQESPLRVGVALTLSRPVQGSDFVRLGHAVCDRLGITTLRGNGGTTCDPPVHLERLRGTPVDVTDLHLFAALLENSHQQEIAEAEKNKASADKWEPWMASLYTLKDSTQPQKVNINLSIMLSNMFPGVFRWNKYSKTIDIVVHDQLTEKQQKHAKKIAALPEKAQPLAVQQLFYLTFNVEFGKEAIIDAIFLQAHQNAFNPLLDYLNGCIHDGVSRIDSFFITYFGAEDTPHNRRIGRCFLLSAVARAFEPGCKVDNSIILEGPQGLKKTTGIEALAGPFYASTAITLGDKDSKMAASSSWFIEMAELDSIKKAEGKAMKAFLSTRDDFYREPYGVSYKKTPRTCVLIGSTNETEYLAPDDTGHRRPWPVRCTFVDVAGLLRDRDVLWGEVVAVYKTHTTCEDCKASTDTVFGQAPRCAAHRWWLDKAEEEEAAEVALEREEQDNDSSLEGLIRRWWNGMTPDRRPQRFEMLMIQEDVLKMEELEIAKNGRNVAIGRALAKIGFVRKHDRVPGDPKKFGPWYYVPTTKLLENPKIESKRNLGKVIAFAPVPKKPQE